MGNKRTHYVLRSDSVGYYSVSSLSGAGLTNAGPCLLPSTDLYLPCSSRCLSYGSSLDYPCPQSWGSCNGSLPESFDPDITGTRYSITGFTGSEITLLDRRSVTYTTTQQVTHEGSPGTATAYCGYNCLSMRRPSDTGAEHLYTARSSGLDRYTISASYTTSGFCRSSFDHSSRGHWDYDCYVAVCCYPDRSSTCPRGWGHSIWPFWGLDSSSDRTVGSHVVSTCNRVRGYYQYIPGPFAILGSYFANAVASSTSTVTTTHYRT